MKKALTNTLLLSSFFILASCSNQLLHKPAIEKISNSTVTQVFSGLLPCRTCSGIETRIILQGTSTEPEKKRHFILTTHYLGKGNIPSDEHYEGYWQVITHAAKLPDATIYKLIPVPMSGQAENFYFLQSNDNTLELIDPQLVRFENAHSLQLQRQQ